MITISGRDIVPGGTNAPSLYDMGYALARVPRFGGHTQKPWTVFQHLHSAYLLAKYQERSNTVQLHALLHDAHESITGDIPTQWKSQDMKVYQKELDIRIYNSINFPLPTKKQYEIVKQIDTLLLDAEAKAIGCKINVSKTDELASNAVLVCSLHSDVPPETAGICFEVLVETLLQNIKQPLLKE